MGNTYLNSKGFRQPDLPDDWLQIKSMDLHTGGEPLRVILDGFPELQGNNVLEYRNDCLLNHDTLRRTLMFEPRGHADMYGCLLVPPNDVTADFGIIFMHNEGYSTMCGHAIIAISVLAFTLGWKPIQTGTNTLIIDAPCGRITSFVDFDAQKNVQNVAFHCVPSFVLALDAQIELPSLGTVCYDLAYGGAFYAYVDLAKNSLGLELGPDHVTRLIDVGMRIKNGIIASERVIDHPFESELGFLYGTIFIDTASRAGLHSKNVCIFADGEVDRCPTGSGVSGRMAIHDLRNEIQLDQPIEIESITGSTFKGSVVERLRYGPYRAVVPKVEGMAYITGSHTFVVDPNDPLKNGFLVR